MSSDRTKMTCANLMPVLIRPTKFLFYTFLSVHDPIGGLEFHSTGAIAIGTAIFFPPDCIYPYGIKIETFTNSLLFSEVNRILFHFAYPEGDYISILIGTIK